MKCSAIRGIFVFLAITVSTPGFADYSEREWRSERRHREHRHHHAHQRGGYWDAPCRVEGWYDRHGRYRERQICQESRVNIAPPALMLAPPSIVIQAPGFYLR